MKRQNWVIFVCLGIFIPMLAFGQHPSILDPEFVYNITDKVIVLDEKNFIQIGDDSTQAYQKIKESRWPWEPLDNYRWQCLYFILELNIKDSKVKNIDIFYHDLFADQERHKDAFDKFKKRFFIIEEYTGNYHFSFKARSGVDAFLNFNVSGVAWSIRIG